MRAVVLNGPHDVSVERVDDPTLPGNRRIAITLLPEARKHLATKGYDPVFGARPLARVIQTEVRDRLTDEILFGKLEQGGTVTIGMTDGTLSFDFVN